ncbi:MAG: hypothetical protein ACPL7J_11465, partial [Desulfomonilaceae bacterium]
MYPYPTLLKSQVGFLCAAGVEKRLLDCNRYDIHVQGGMPLGNKILLNVIQVIVVMAFSPLVKGVRGMAPMVPRDPFGKPSG